MSQSYLVLQRLRWQSGFLIKNADKTSNNTMNIINRLKSVRFWRSFHLYLSLLLSLQLLAWFGSGLVMSILPIDEVRGDHLRNPAPAVLWQTASISPAEISASQTAAVISLKQRGQLPVYQLQQGENQQYFSAVDGKQLLPLSENEVRQLAQAWYRGAGVLSNTQLLTELPLEARGLSSPVWQVQFQDAENTVFYLDPMLGQLLRVRTDNWRLFDFVWMLHIMDYQDRDDFNHGLLIASSALALLFTISGLVLLVLTLRRKTAK
jgi:uncharacterized iron-regulated membrane protein